jgi:hypothetical protein
VERKRFELALERLPASSWELFEHLASAFAVVDYPNLRTLASPAGDQGRDAILYSPEQDDGLVLQYSVTESWSDKIRQTARRLKDQFPNVRELIYVTNKVIGPKADEIRRSLRREFNLYLDVWDRSCSSIA